ncbi:MAG: FAD-binding protein, partial [Nonomuraea sp.]|nr:FAD-binding protein [Nonomuraea sp.]
PKLRSMELGPRDRLSQAFVHEQEKGRTVDTPYGPVVYLDLRHLGEGKIDSRIPFVRELCRSYQNLDPATDLIPVRPVVHYMMGGVHTDIDGATPITGLYAAGETACVSINGANRLGSNSLPEILVFGRRAGLAAAAFAKEHRGGEAAAVRSQGSDERRRLERAREGRRTGERVADLRELMQHTLEGAAGIYRTGDVLAKAADTLADLGERAEEAVVEDTSTAFNTELINLQELHTMLEVARTIVACALNRQESRGAHQRTDFPARDDDAYLAHSLVHRAPDGSPSVGLLPVTITRWPPGERVYGRD